MKLHPNANGVEIIQPKVARAALPWERDPKTALPQRGCISFSWRQGGYNPVGVEIVFRFPRVGDPMSHQPWAERWNTVGVPVRRGLTVNQLVSRGTGIVSNHLTTDQKVYVFPTLNSQPSTLNRPQ